MVGFLYAALVMQLGEDNWVGVGMVIAVLEVSYRPVRPLFFVVGAYDAFSVAVSYDV